MENVPNLICGNKHVINMIGECCCINKWKDINGNHFKMNDTVMIMNRYNSRVIIGKIVSFSNDRHNLTVRIKISDSAYNNMFYSYFTEGDYVEIISKFHPKYKEIK